MQLVPVRSSDLAAVGYDPIASLLEVQFLDGRAYQYSGVPAVVHQRLMTAPSKGRYFDRFVKRARYSWARVR
ncbi:KTSC domain-containing protein [Kitasatospora mediocidica]|uniref:KTSC domain-containing protein n=1 Tax=Kitasatospora mediocidica TaxID=58352 RepID=UPI00055CC22E|nr:KTSC domain-containing protein [Kitasatospora mediocidica]